MSKRELEDDDLGGSPRGLPRSIGRAALPFFFGLSLISGAWAGVVFKQLPLGGNDAFPSISTAQTADDFVFSATTAISGLTWWGSYSDDPDKLSPDAFRVSIHADDGSGHPAIDPAVEFTLAPTRTPTRLADVSGADVYRYDLALPSHFVLAGRSTFYLSVVNEFDVKDPDATWYWLLSDAVGANFYRAAYVDPWGDDATGNFSFAINGKATTPGPILPLPGTLVLLLSGLAAMTLPRGDVRSLFSR
ncbi:hypothetical protein [Candidatus Accumulibacter vicinus]|uniref:DUF7901 domain-containing protein n=1 Tax=Candidatus Accumulibacter vicinus TaxID=2954382 RepID=A0A084XY17_9PROT|nr:hypothetical protein [Candidatus Accumulibacter vicinus]KFB67361.1 MAG: hypothetical protein CAPSK01_003279 [Candidatus Accumulibacter vicinus]